MAIVRIPGVPLCPWQWISMRPGLPFLKSDPPAGSKSVEDLREVKQAAGLPFIVKGIMTVGGAAEGKRSRGRCDRCVKPRRACSGSVSTATAEGLEEIANAVYGSMKIFVVDGGRHPVPVDVFKSTGTGG